MPLPVLTPTAVNPPADQARRRHRWIVVLAGSSAIAGSILAIAMNPAWALLAAAGGLALLLLPDRKACCGHAKGGQP